MTTQTAPPEQLTQPLPTIPKIPTYDEVNKWSPYSDYASSETVLLRFLEVAGISQYKLNRLIGADGSKVWRWIKGYERPSSKYLLRILTVSILVTEGYDLAPIREIDWEEGKAILKDSTIDGTRRHLPVPTERDVPHSPFFPRQ